LILLSDVRFTCPPYSSDHRKINIERLQSHHLYWPDLDIDLTVESIEHPEKFPLIAVNG